MTFERDVDQEIQIHNIISPHRLQTSFYRYMAVFYCLVGKW